MLFARPRPSFLRPVRNRYPRRDNFEWNPKIARSAGGRTGGPDLMLFQSSISDYTDFQALGTEKVMDVSGHFSAGG